MTESTKGSHALVHTAPQQLTVQSSWLVERCIRSLPLLGITERCVQELCSALQDWDFDIRARALEKIVDLGPLVRSCRRYLDSLIFPVADNIHTYFGPEATVNYIIYQHDLFSHGRHYPPGAEYLELLRTALESLVGPVQSPDEAIMDVIYYGTTASRIRAVKWLADHTTTSNIHQAFSDYLDMSLISITQKTPLLLALRYADAALNDPDEAVYFYVDEIIFKENLEELKVTAREYLLRLHDQTSQEVLIYAFSAMAKSRYWKDAECASKVFYEVMSRDLGEYSDDDLEIICSFKGWPSDEQDEVDEDEESVMEELQKRGLRG